MEVLQFYSKSKIKNDPETMGGVINWRQRLSNFWPVRISPITIIVEGRELFNEGMVFSSVEQAFHYAKFGFTAQKMSNDEIIDPFKHYPDVLTQSIKPDRVNDATFKEQARPFMVQVKGSSGKGKMKKAGYTLDVVTWNRARVAVMEHLLLARWVSDGEFRSILIASQGKNLLHFERTGPKSFWGGSIDKKSGEIKGQNTLGKIMMKLRDDYEVSNACETPTKTSTPLYTQFCRSG